MVGTVSQKQRYSGVLFEQLPDILIQDPVRKCSYLLRSEEMGTFKVSSKDWNKIDSSTVTFTIAGEEEISEVVPPFNAAPGENTSVLIQYPYGEAAYLLSHSQLQQFIIEQPVQKNDYGISFVIPMGMEMIEELPSLMKSMLQTGESPNLM